MNAAVAAADFKTGFGTQFMQPFADESLYTSYSPYNNWTKVPSPLGTKPFPWPVNPLVSTNHHQNSVNCFNTSASGVAVSMNSGTMLPGGMGSTLATGGTGAGVSAPPCPYTTPTYNSVMYHPRAAAEPCTAMSSSIATLRLKAKQHTSGFASPYSASSPVSRSNSAGLSACQYAGVTDAVWENALGALLSHHQHQLHNNHINHNNNNNNVKVTPGSDDDALMGPSTDTDDVEEIRDWEFRKGMLGGTGSFSNVFWAINHISFLSDNWQALPIRAIIIHSSHAKFWG